MAARFDLLAAFFVLLTLLTFCRFLENRSAWWYVPLAVFATLALLSKESAYCLPLLMLCIVPLRPQGERKAGLAVTGFLAMLCTGLFAYRFWIVHGFGGYQTPSHRAAIAQFSIVRTAKALLYREWALLFFPINWSEVLGLWLKVALIVGLVGLFALAAGFCRGERTQILVAVAFILSASLPVQHLLLLGADLNGARVLYLPVLGFALLIGFLLQGCRSVARQLLIGLAILIFQCAALEHNLKIWRDVAFLAQRTCKSVGDELQRDPQAIEVIGLPAQLHGVFFLRNGFPECVAVNSGQSEERVVTSEDSRAVARPGMRIFRWNNRAEKLEEKFGLRSEVPGNIQN